MESNAQVESTSASDGFLSPYESPDIVDYGSLRELTAGGWRVWQLDHNFPTFPPLRPQRFS
jgi:hypothetical protein